MSHQRRIFQFSPDHLENNKNVPYFVQSENDVANLEKNEFMNEEEEDDMEIAMNKLSSKLISDLTRRHSKLAKNVIESAEDRIGQPENHFLDDGEASDDSNDYWDDEEEEIIEEAEFIHETNDEELKNILKKAKESGYLQTSSNHVNDTNTETHGESSDEQPKRESTELRIDPNYKWLLKDLNLNNDKRVIDVTDVIELNESKRDLTNDQKNEDEKVNEPQELKEQNISPNKLIEINELVDDFVKKIDLENSRDLTKDEENNITASEPDECKNDAGFINELYQRLVSKEEDPDNTENQIFQEREDESSIENDSKSSSEEKLAYSNEDDNIDDDIGNRTTNDAEGIYKKWSKQFRSSQNDQADTEADATEYLTESLRLKPERKKPREFSKSFEISLDDIDNLTDRVDNGIKFKRNKNPPEATEVKEATITISSNDREPNYQTVNESEMCKDDAHAFEMNQKSTNVIESMKKEWSSMFNKLETDYQKKLNEQQKQNESRLKELHDEIKQSIKIQQQQYREQHELVAPAMVTCSEIVTKQTIINDRHESEETSSATSTNFHDNSKYISNIRNELKAKHSRHVKDLREYYEKELEELRNQLSLKETQMSESNESNRIGNIIKPSEDKANYDNQLILNNELKNSNNVLLNKLYKSSQHVRLVTEENCDLANKINQSENELRNANEKINNLENCCNQLEQQLTETIKLQNQYIRELHVEKRNIVKKMQECEELKMNVKFYEQKCESYELKFDEKDIIITRLKSQLIQLESDYTRLEYDYKKSLNKYSSNTNLNQFTNQQDMKQKGQQLPIKHMNNGLLVSTGSPTSSSSLSPASPKAVNCQSNQYSVKNRSPSPGSVRFGSSSITQAQISKRLSLNNQRNPNTISHSSSFSMGNGLNSPKEKSNQESHFQQEKKEKNHQNSRQIQRNFSISPRRFADSEMNEKSPFTKNKKVTNANQRNFYDQQQQHIKSEQFNNNYYNMDPDKKLKYIEQMEYEFDMLMKHKQQLDAKLTRLPFKATNSNMHNLRESVENELDCVDKKLSSVKLELRKLNIIKSH